MTDEIERLRAALDKAQERDAMLVEALLPPRKGAEAMSDDLVERLRFYGTGTAIECADEIERLRAEVSAYKKERIKLYDRTFDAERERDEARAALEKIAADGYRRDAEIARAALAKEPKP
jgi:hypothetical protein